MQISINTSRDINFSSICVLQPGLKKMHLGSLLKKGTFLKELPLWKTLPHTLLDNSGAIPVATPIELYQINKCRQEIETKRVTAGINEGMKRVVTEKRMIMILNQSMSHKHMFGKLLCLFPP